jgi:2-aminoadipate transaminase
MSASGDLALPALRYASRSALLSGSIIDSSTSILARYPHDIVRFAMGSPARDAIPSDVLVEIAARELRAPAAFDYAATEGDPGLIEEVVRMLDGQGRRVDPERILITAGGMQGLDLVCKLFVEPGDLTVVEGPTYTNGTATIASYQGTFLEVPVDDDGMLVDALVQGVEAAGRTPSLIYSIPNFQNPSGTTLSRERRVRLVELAERWNAVVLEDDPYGLIRFSGDPLPSLAELADRPERVIRVETFSKVLAPGLRVGWIEADPSIVRLMVNAKQAMDTCTNLPAQRLVGAFLREGHMEAHLATLRSAYRERRDVMQDALAASFPEPCTWTFPDGGMFLWLTLPEPVDAEHLFHEALDDGVAFIPGAAFSVAGRFQNALRLCFATNGPDRIREGVGRLRGTVERLYPGLL